jgi:hypothetical protein
VQKHEVVLFSPANERSNAPGRETIQVVSQRGAAATGSDRGFGEPQMNANERRYDQSLSASTSAKVGVPLQQTCPENHQ